MWKKYLIKKKEVFDVLKIIILNDFKADMGSPLLTGTRLAGLFMATDVDTKVSVFASVQGYLKFIRHIYANKWI